MRRWSSRSSAALALCAVLWGCAARTPQFVTSSSVAADAKRRPPGVAEPRAPVSPEPTRSGDAQDELILLRAPAAPELARQVVRSFLRAAVNETPERLELLLAPQAFIDTSGGRQPARSFWRTRLSQLDYTELKGQLLFRDSDLETFRAEDLARLPAGRRIPLELGVDEVAVRVPIRVSWAGRTRLFGDELVFRLQPAGSRFEIAEISEDFRLP
ncbi:MAG TPA: hypothetical protein VK745_16315 [Polyangiaceae bacterium]|jgi:hypothetical protein|nr:hypothetical protein [Polyangiaceae bacterium]